MSANGHLCILPYTRQNIHLSRAYTSGARTASDTDDFSHYQHTRDGTTVLTFMRLLLVLGITTAFAVQASAQNFIAPPGAAAKIFPKPQRSVADIVGPIWYGEKERDAARETQQAARFLGIRSGMTIADIGAGSGYYVVSLAPMIGPRGRIFAEDVVPEYLRALRKRLRNRGVQNVTIVLGEPHDARLPAHSLDRAILVHMYHEITQPYGLVYNLVPAFKQGARLGIIDSIAPTSRHGTPPNLLRCELAAVGYREIAFHPLRGSSAYLAIFAPPSEEDRIRPEAIKPCKMKKPS
jgi:SAM-dependent methyltransferase